MNTANIIEGFGGDDVLISRAASDLLDGGEGDDIFYVPARNGIRVITGSGSDLVVIDEQIFHVDQMTTVSDPDDGDTIRFYNPETFKFLDVPFQLAKEEILSMKGLTELITPEVVAGILVRAKLNGTVELVGLICDEQEDINSTCFVVSLVDNNNNAYLPP